MKLSVKIDTGVKSELTKIAGERQIETGNEVSISDAISFLIDFYRKKKGAS